MEFGDPFFVVFVFAQFIAVLGLRGGFLGWDEHGLFLFALHLLIAVVSGADGGGGGGGG